MDRVTVSRENVSQRVRESETVAIGRRNVEIENGNNFTYSPLPTPWSGIAAPLITALFSAAPTCEGADKLRDEGYSLEQKANLAKTNEEREAFHGSAAEKFKAAAAKYRECNNPSAEALAINWYRTSYFSTNKIPNEEQSKVYRLEAEAYVRASDSVTDPSLKIQHLWRAGEAKMRIGVDEIDAANGLFEKAYQLSLTLKELKYGHAADSRHFQALALKDAAYRFQKPELYVSAAKINAEAEELSVKAREEKSKKEQQ